MRFYIASGLENADYVKELARWLERRGWRHTYDWTAHGSVQDDGPERMAQVALAELDGVARSQVVIALMPGGKGTHTEIGYALGLGKPVLIVGETYSKTDGRECVFYYAPGVRVLKTPESPSVVAEAAQVWAREFAQGRLSRGR